MIDQPTLGIRNYTFPVMIDHECPDDTFYFADGGLVMNATLYGLIQADERYRELIGGIEDQIIAVGREIAEMRNE